MTISAHILNDIAIQPITQKVRVLKELFNELTCSHLPIAKDGTYIGCVSENDLRCFEGEKTLADYQYAITPFFVKKTDPILDILKAFAVNDTNLIPVISEKNKHYLGYFELIDILNILKDTPFLIENGNIIVVEKSEHDYSLSEISQIVESNEGKIYGSYISAFTNGITQITLKISESRLNEILQTFRRYGYRIVSEHQEDSFIQNLKERSDYLNKYLNI